MRWGVVATIKAPVADVLNFVAHHLEIGADHLFIYLDDDNPEAQAALDAHPQVSVTRTDTPYWKAGGKHRPAKHQARQTRNATHAYTQATTTNLDWLMHMDVDEFLWAERPLSDLLAALPAKAEAARVRPIEALSPPDGPSAGGVTHFKGFVPAHGKRQEISQALFPTFGNYVKGGFLSHVQGKVFVRTGMSDIEIRIHNAFKNGIELSETVEFSGVDLCHLHVRDWDSWQAHYRYRHNRGSYRSELKPAIATDHGGLTLHQLFAMLEAENGKNGLRAFFDEVCVARPDLLQALEARGLLRSYALDLEEKRARHFPDYG
ncbi:glycosyltransferase family 2 protein [Shimia sp. SDUM112013]|uniref:glycosyltransferase family 2 protein n=1 Tax=Shimia sp. SDUM112013 TaxID=3136160 RepID=UPI0032EAB0FA